MAGCTVLGIGGKASDRRGRKLLKGWITALLGWLCLALLPRPCAAQSVSEFQNWTALASTAQLNREIPSARLWLDVHARRGASGTTVILRPGFGYSFAPWITAWAGYAWIPVMSDGSAGRTDEHRIWEQLTLQHAWKNGSLFLQSRTRFEQRFHESSSTVGFRLREFVRFNYRPDPDSPFGLAVWDEVFVGLNEPGFAVQGYDQNRLFVGPAIYALQGFRVEAGYLFAHLNREPVNQLQHVLAVNLFVNLKP